MYFLGHCSNLTVLDGHFVPLHFSQQSKSFFFLGNNPIPNFGIRYILINCIFHILISISFYRLTIFQDDVSLYMIPE